MESWVFTGICEGVWDKIWDILLVWNLESILELGWTRGFEIFHLKND